MHYTPQEEDRIRAEIDAAKAERLSASAPSETACQPRSLALATGSAVCVSCEKRRATWRTYDGDYCHDCMQAHHLEKMLVQLGRLNHR